MTSRPRRRQRRMLSGLTAVLLGVALSGTLATASQAARPPGHGQPTHQRGPVVHTDGGVVRGSATGDLAAFKGIPYAAPPVDALRWQAPQPAASWSGIRDASSFAPHCAQSPSPYGLASTSEDCLYLNVVTPTAHHRGSHALPVMVWIHGGALVTGLSDGYDPETLVRDGVVVVTLNYRLGALGFLADPALAGPDGASGNYGLMDQQAALRWVQRNIAGFGGDPDQVTIFGESAGGLSVLSQVASPQAKGLFSGAIVESGAYSLDTRSQAAADQLGEGFASSVGCADAADTADCLRALPVTTVLAQQTSGGYTPNVDGSLLTQPIRTALATGQFNRVPLVNGSNADEWRLFVAPTAGSVTPSTYSTFIAGTLGLPPAKVAQVVTEYPLSSYATPALALSALGTDAIFACPAYAVDLYASKYVPVHAYEFADPDAPQLFLPPVANFPFGAAHASEIQYLFDLPGTPQAGSLNDEQQQLADTMQAYWTGFATDHTPAGPATPGWPAFTAHNPAVQSLVPPTPVTDTDFAASHHCGFWAALAG